MRQAAAEAAPRGVRINAVAPSADCHRPSRSQTGAVANRHRPGFPLGGWARSRMRPARFLLSDAAGWITGVTLDVAAGVSWSEASGPQHPSLFTLGIGDDVAPRLAPGRRRAELARLFEAVEVVAVSRTWVASLTSPGRPGP